MPASFEVTVGWCFRTPSYRWFAKNAPLKRYRTKKHLENTISSSYSRWSLKWKKGETYCWWLARKPVEVGSWNPMISPVLAPSKRWLALGFLNHQTVVRKTHLQRQQNTFMFKPPKPSEPHRAPKTIPGRVSPYHLCHWALREWHRLTCGKQARRDSFWIWRWWNLAILLMVQISG